MGKLDEALRTNQPLKLKKDLEAFFPIQPLDAVVRVGFPQRPRKEKRTRFDRRLKDCLTHSNNAFAATHDGPTGLLNKDSIEGLVRDGLTPDKGVIESELGSSGAILSTQTVAVMVLDIDHFKQLNDTFGHLYGDIVLKCFAARIEQICQTMESPSLRVDVGRSGGEEFMVVLRGFLSDEKIDECARALLVTTSETPLPSDSEWAKHAAEAAADALDLPHVSDRRITISVGTAQLPIDDRQEPDRKRLAARLVNQADTALYRAKAGGRDTVRHFEKILDRYGRVLEHHTDSGVVAIDIGSQVNVTLGQEFLVFHPDFDGTTPFVFSDGRTRKRIGNYPRYSCGRIVAFDVQPEVSFCRVVEAPSVGRFQPNSHLEAVPVGAFSHLLAADPQLSSFGGPDLLRAEQLADRARVISESGRAPVAAVFAPRDVADLTRDRGTAFVNQSLARLFGVLRESFPPPASIGQLQSSEIGVVLPASGDFEAVVAKAVETAFDRCRGLVSFVAGLFIHDGDQADGLLQDRALEFARFAVATATDRTDSAVRRFSDEVAVETLAGHRKSRRWAQARADYKALVDMGVHNADVENQIGLCLFEQDDSDVDAALSAFMRALVLRPAAVFHANAGIMLFKRKDFQASWHHFVEAHKSSPQFEFPIAYRGAVAIAACEANAENPGSIEPTELIRLLLAAKEVPSERRLWLDDRAEIEAILRRLGLPAQGANS